MILATGWTPIDPILSVLVAVLIVRSAWPLLRESTHILMENTPDYVDLGALRAALMTTVPGIRDVHDVHCWSLTTGQTMLSLHVALGGDADADAVLREAKRVLAENFAIAHSALQIEHGDCPDEACRAMTRHRRPGRSVGASRRARTRCTARSAGAGDA